MVVVAVGPSKQEMHEKKSMNERALTSPHSSDCTGEDRRGICAFCCYVDTVWTKFRTRNGTRSARLRGALQNFAFGHDTDFNRNISLFFWCAQSSQHHWPQNRILSVFYFWLLYYLVDRYRPRPLRAAPSAEAAQSDDLAWVILPIKSASSRVFFTDVFKYILYVDLS